MKKIITIVIGIAILAGVSSWLYRALASDTTKIRWLIEGMAQSFNSSRAGGTVSGLSDDFLDETSRVGKSDVHQFLAVLYLRERDEQTKEFRYRVDLDEPAIELLGEGRREARLTVTARFSRRRGEDWTLTWVVDIEAQLRNDDGGWCITRTTHETREGKPPF